MAFAAIMIHLRYLPGAIVARKVSASGFSHSLDPKRKLMTLGAYPNLPRAGGGVVADGDPETEYQETCSKTRALVRAAEEAIRFAAKSG